MWLKNASVYDVCTGKCERQDLQVEEGRIASMGGKAPSHAEAIDLDGAFLLPGFFDCHVHICVDTHAKSVANLWQGALPGTIALFAASAAKKMLLCGITTARDVGGWDYHEIAVREAINSGLIVGPRLFCAGKILSMTSASTPMWRGMYEECDGPAEVRKAARKQLAMGANFIKLLATGAVNSSKYERARSNCGPMRSQRRWRSRTTTSPTSLRMRMRCRASATPSNAAAARWSMAPSATNRSSS